MNFGFIQTELTEKGSRGLEENIFLDDLDSDYKVFVFYFPVQIDKEFDEKLMALSRQEQSSSYVNIGNIMDPNFQKLSSKFNIYRLPAIIITAISDYALLEREGHFLTVYFKIENVDLTEYDKVVDAVANICNLFISKTISKVIKQISEEDKSLTRIRTSIIDALMQKIPIDKGNKISISFTEGKFETKRVDHTSGESDSEHVLIKNSYDLLDSYNEQSPDIVTLKEISSNLLNIRTLELPNNSKVIELEQKTDHMLQSLRDLANRWINNINAFDRTKINEIHEPLIQELSEFNLSLNRDTLITIDRLNLCLLSTVCDMITNKSTDIDVFIRRCKTCQRRYGSAIKSIQIE